jgi:hypothetical protein
MIYKIHLYTDIWDRVTKFIVSYGLEDVPGVGVEGDHSIGFAQAEPSIEKFLPFLGTVGDTISINNNKQNLTFTVFCGLG